MRKEYNNTNYRRKKLIYIYKEVTYAEKLNINNRYNEQNMNLKRG